MKLVRKKMYDAEKLLPVIEEHFIKHKTHIPKSINIDGFNVNISSKVIRLFLKKGLICNHCKIKGKIFVIERYNNTSKYHLGLYAQKEGRLVLMTRDHIKPVSKGGSNKLTNTQVLCVHCNVKKGNKYKGKD